MQGFGERLRKKREEKGFSQKQLATLIGKKSYTSIGEWENEKQSPTVYAIVQLAALLNTTPNYLMLGIIEKDIVAIETENQLLKEALSAYRRAEKAEKELEQSKNIAQKNSGLLP